MKNFPYNNSAYDNLRGHISYAHGGKLSDTNAFDMKSTASINILLPRIMGAVSVYIQAMDESLSRTVFVREAEWCDLVNGEDFFTLDFNPADIGIGLYFYRIFIKLDTHTLYACGNTKGFGFSDEYNASLFQLTVYSPKYKTPTDYFGGIIYHIFVDRFNRKNTPEAKKGAVFFDDWSHGVPEYPAYPGAPLKNNTFYGGTLWGVIDKLDYIKSLGVNLIYLSPIFDAASNHKYDTGDYMTVDEMFGGEEAFIALIDEAKKRDIGIILDGVFNHTGSDSIYFNREGNYNSVGAYNSKKSEYYSWYDFKDYPDKYTCWWDIDILPRINPDIPECKSYFIGKGGVIEKYAKLGVAGFRLDVVDELSDSFVEGIKATLNKHNKGSILYGEVWEDASNKIAYDKRKRYYLGSELDGVMNYPIRKGIISYLTRGDYSALGYALTDVINNAPVAVRNMQMNLLGTHDTERIITLLGGESSAGRSNTYLRTARMNDIERGTAKRRIRMAYTILATVPGIPVIFYGDETALEGYHDPFNRMPYPWDRQDKKLIDFYRKIGGIRRDNDVYKDGDFKLVELTSDLLIFSRTKGEKTCITVVNNTKQSISVTLDAKATALIGGASDATSFELEPFTAEIFSTTSNNTIYIN